MLCSKVVFVLFEHTDPLQNTKLRALFSDVAGQNYDEHYFGVVSDAKVLEDYKIDDAPRIGVLKEGELFLYEQPDTEPNANEHLTKWVLDNQFTLLPEMEHYLYGEITGRGKLVVVTIVDPHDKASVRTHAHTHAHTHTHTHTHTRGVQEPTARTCR